MTDQYLSEETLKMLREAQGKPEPFLIRQAQRLRGNLRWKGRGLAKLVADVCYSAKLLRGVASGFDGLVVRDGDEWASVPHTRHFEVGWDGESRNSSIKFHTGEDPYYVCVQWKNGTHTPLPLILDQDGDYGLQNWILAVLNKWQVKPFADAQMHSAYYEHQFDTP